MTNVMFRTLCNQLLINNWNRNCEMNMATLQDIYTSNYIQSNFVYINGSGGWWVGQGLAACCMSPALQSPTPGLMENAIKRYITAIDRTCSRVITLIFSEKWIFVC